MLRIIQRCLLRVKRWLQEKWGLIVVLSLTVATLCFLISLLGFASNLFTGSGENSLMWRLTGVYGGKAFLVGLKLGLIALLPILFPILLNNTKRISFDGLSRAANSNKIRFFILFNFISFVLVSCWWFSINEASLFGKMDGDFARTLLQQQMLWKGFEFGFGANFFQSIGGNMWFPLNTILDPGYAMGNITGHFNVGLAYTVWALELFLSTLMLSRILGLTWWTSLMASWALPLFTLFPIAGWPLVYPVLKLAPHFATFIALGTILIALVISNDHESVFKKAGRSIGIFLVVLFLLVSHPTHLILIFPIVGLCGLISVVHSENAKERTKKILTLLAPLVALFTIGSLHYLFGLFDYTATRFFPGDFENDRMSMSFVSILFDGGFGCLLMLFGVVGAVLVAKLMTGLSRVVAMSLLIMTFLIFGAGFITTRIDLWKGPSPLYFEFISWPLYAIFGAVTIVESIGLIGNRFVRPLKERFGFAVLIWNKIGMILLAILLFAFIGLVASKSPVYRAWQYPYPESNIVKTLKSEISIRPGGDDFRGRVATFTGLNIERSLNCHDLADLDGEILLKFGFYHRLSGLWINHLPTLAEYNSNITPAFHLFAKTLFERKGDRQIRSLMILRKIDHRLLAMIGVRFVITDAPLGDLSLRSQVRLDKSASHYLYELPDPNIGQYSPTHILLRNKAKDILALLQAPSFNPMKDVVLGEAIAKDLVKAQKGQIIVVKNGLLVSAISSGYSLILLPIEYSHCFKMTVKNKPPQPPRLIRANLLQGAILFKGELDVEMSYFTGPFCSQSCRIEDARTFEELL